MTTSRQQGILCLKTDKPYKMDSGGQKTEQTEITCYEPGYDEDNIALDLIQMINTATMNMGIKLIGLNGNKTSTTEPIQDTFLTDECPTDIEIKKHANILQMSINNNKEIKMSEFMDMFVKLVNAGKVKAFGNVSMQEKAIWDTISREDRQNIAFCYTAFFLKPLQQVEKSSMLTESKSKQDPISV